MLGLACWDGQALGEEMIEELLAVFCNKISYNEEQRESLARCALEASQHKRRQKVQPQAGSTDSNVPQRRIGREDIRRSGEAA